MSMHAGTAYIFLACLVLGSKLTMATWRIVRIVSDAP